jgi:ribosomal-protein-alanine N-acetyltransferase
MAIFDSDNACHFLGLQDRANAYEIMLSAQAKAWSYDTFCSCLVAPYQCIGIYHDKQLLGFYIIQAILTPAHREWTLMEIVVARAAQNQGVGRQLLQHLCKSATRQNIDEIWLEVRASNSNAIHLYRDIGFVDIETRRAYYPGVLDESIREDALVMCYYPQHVPSPS